VNRDWVKVGSIFVDAGIVMVGDPCYSFGADSTAMPELIGGNTWSKFCEYLKDDRVASVGHLGVVVQSGYGDGEYDVFVQWTTCGEKRVKAVMVVFIDEDDGEQ
jgi:hypothetical protein